MCSIKLLYRHVKKQVGHVLSRSQSVVFCKVKPNHVAPLHTFHRHLLTHWSTYCLNAQMVYKVLIIEHNMSQLLQQSVMIIHIRFGEDELSVLPRYPPPP